MKNLLSLSLSGVGQSHSRLLYFSPLRCYFYVHPKPKERELATVSQTQKKVQSILTAELGSVRVDADGDINIAYESTHVRVSVEQFSETVPDETVVVIGGILTFGTPASPKLYKWINDKNALLKFGAISYYEDDDGKDPGALMLLKYSILGDFLDPEELLNALRSVTIISDVLDDQVVEEFGGKRAVDL